jgi:hypothetical protein
MDTPTFVVLKRWADHLAGLMPASIVPTTGHPVVPVYYSNPGDRVLGPDCVWFDRINDDYDVIPLKAGRRRRLITTTFQVVIEVFLEGPSAANDASSLQYDCDVQAAAIRQVIDEDIADEEHLQCPDLIDVAKLVRGRAERGLTATGAGTRVVLDVSFDSRIL